MKLCELGLGLGLEVEKNRILKAALLVGGQRDLRTPIVLTKGDNSYCGGKESGKTLKSFQRTENDIAPSTAVEYDCEAAQPGRLVLTSFTKVYPTVTVTLRYQVGAVDLIGVNYWKDSRVSRGV